MTVCGDLEIIDTKVTEILPTDEFFKGHSDKNQIPVN